MEESGYKRRYLGDDFYEKFTPESFEKTYFNSYEGKKLELKEKEKILNDLLDMYYKDSKENNEE